MRVSPAFTELRFSIHLKDESRKICNSSIYAGFTRIHRTSVNNSGRVFKAFTVELDDKDKEDVAWVLKQRIVRLI